MPYLIVVSNDRRLRVAEFCRTTVCASAAISFDVSQTGSMHAISLNGEMRTEFSYDKCITIVRTPGSVICHSRITFKADNSG